MKKYCIALFILLVCLQANAQDTIPMLKGSVTLSVTKGTIECNFILSNIPKINDYYIRLNAGMNIRYIKNLNGIRPLSYERSSHDSLGTGEANAYYIEAYNESGKFLPRAMQMSYVGMFPVIADTAAVVDWKGNIAFNGNTVRTDGSQSAWYPVLYDIKKDRKYDKVAYDIEINCADCKTIHLNGSDPMQGTYAHFKSDVPQELTMFSGNYKMVDINGSYFLNADMDETQLKAFEKIIRDTKDYYEKNLQIPFKGRAAYVHTTPVSKYNSWMFASYPTIVEIGFREKPPADFVEKQKAYMAHELGHYYFGNSRVFNSELGDMISEGFSEYMALNVTRKMISESTFKERIQSKLHAMRNFKPVAFASVRSKNDYADRELYVYYYAPLIFTAIEKEIGEQAMWKWMRTLIQTPAGFTNYRFIEQTLSDVLNDKTKFELIRTKYFTTNDVLTNVAQRLEINAPSQNSASATPVQPVAKTVYYFFFTKPVIDAGSPENGVVKHSEILQFTGTPSEIAKMADAKFENGKSQCENEGGCSADFNTYNSMDDAKTALKRWLSPYVDKPRFAIKKLVLTAD
jgi:hypothetical protein